LDELEGYMEVLTDNWAKFSVTANMGMGIQMEWLERWWTYLEWIKTKRTEITRYIEQRINT
jgi:hypothetical protein